MKHSKLILFLLVSFLANKTFSQIENINTDRPDQSDGVYVLSKGRVQLENGLTLQQETVMNNFMLRWGITNSTEVRLLIDGGKLGGLNGIAPLSFSFKQRIINQKKLAPSITLIGYISCEKIASHNLQSKNISSNFKLAFEKDISSKLSLGQNIGISNDFQDINLTTLAVYGVTDKISTFLEYFATLNNEFAEHNFDTGILAVLKPNLQLDLAIGRAIFDTENRLYTTFGVSYLFE
jgi:Putative MetA-pathway of phenol degradation